LPKESNLHFHFIALGSIWISCFRLYIGFFLPAYASNILYSFSLPLARSLSSVHPILLDFIIVIISVDKYKIWSAFSSLLLLIFYSFQTFSSLSHSQTFSIHAMSLEQDTKF
jgi:hypothetical protein